MSLLQRSTIVTAMLTALALPAMAQSTAAATAAPAATQTQAAPGQPHQRAAQRQARMEKRMQALKASLQLNASQEAAWNSYVAAIKPQPHHEGERPAHADKQALAAMTTPERLDAMQAMHNQRHAAMQARMEQRSQATKTFYAALNPAQQKTFDAETLKMHEGRRGHGRHHGEPRGHGKQPGARTAPATPALDSK